MTAALSLDRLPARLLASEVAELFRFSKQTLARRRKEAPDWLPASAVQGGKETMFDRDAVLKALGVANDDKATDQADPWAIEPDALRAALSRKVRDGSAGMAKAASRGRDAAGVLSGARKAAPLRLAVSNPSADHR